MSVSADVNNHTFPWLTDDCCCFHCIVLSILRFVNFDILLANSGLSSNMASRTCSLSSSAMSTRSPISIKAIADKSFYLQSQILLSILCPSTYCGTDIPHTIDISVGQFRLLLHYLCSKNTIYQASKSTFTSIRISGGGNIPLFGGRNLLLFHQDQSSSVMTHAMLYFVGSASIFSKRKRME